MKVALILIVAFVAQAYASGICVCSGCSGTDCAAYAALCTSLGGVSTCGVGSTASCTGVSSCTNGLNICSNGCTNSGCSGYTWTCAQTSSCFSTEGATLLQNGTTKKIANLEVGDMVQAVDSKGRLFFDKVFRVSHNDPAAMTPFIRVSTTANKTLELSPSHYMHSGAACCDINNLTLAQDLKVGDIVYTLDESTGSRVLATKITKLEHTVKRGAFNVHVLGGSIVVNGVAASHFSTESKWSVNSAATKWYQVVDVFNRLAGGTSETRGAAIAKSRR